MEPSQIEEKTGGVQCDGLKNSERGEGIQDTAFIRHFGWDPFGDASTYHT